MLATSCLIVSKHTHSIRIAFLDRPVCYRNLGVRTVLCPLERRIAQWGAYLTKFGVVLEELKTSNRDTNRKNLIERPSIGDLNLCPVLSAGHPGLLVIPADFQEELVLSRLSFRSPIDFSRWFSRLFSCLRRFFRSEPYSCAD